VQSVYLNTVKKLSGSIA